MIHSETIKRVTRYAWSDTPSTVKVSIEDAWDYSAISEGDVSIARPSDTALTISVKYEGCTHRLALTNLRSPLDDAKVKVRKKRLVVTLTKRETLLASDKAWPDLFCSAASFPASTCPRRWRTGFVFLAEGRGGRLPFVVFHRRYLHLPEDT